LQFLTYDLIAIHIVFKLKFFSALIDKRKMPRWKSLNTRKPTVEAERSTESVKSKELLSASVGHNISQAQPKPVELRTQRFQPPVARYKLLGKKVEAGQI
jgi:hypothetical protein